MKASGGPGWLRNSALKYSRLLPKTYKPDQRLETAVGTLEGQVELQNKGIAALKKGKISCPICAQDWSAKFVLKQSSHILEYYDTSIPPLALKRDSGAKILLICTELPKVLVWNGPLSLLEPYTSYGPNHEIPS